MRTFFGSLLHMLSHGNPIMMISCTVMLLLLLVLAILHHKWRDDDDMLGKWRLLGLLPLLCGIVHFVGFVILKGYPFGFFISIYLAAILSIFPMLLAKRRIGYRVFAVITGLLSSAISVVFMLVVPHKAFFTRMSYTDSFRAAVSELEKNYILKEWKEVDFAALEAKYLPQIEEAEQEQNAVKFCDTVEDFAMELHDGHVWVGFSPEYDAAKSQYKQHEYGLGLIPLDSGEVIAVNTVAEVQKCGIEDGTIITKWNGKPIAQAVAEDVRDMGMPVKANADIMQTINLAGVGGETVDVTFRAKNGKEKTVTLSDLGEMHTLRETINTFAHCPDPDAEDDNFSTKMLDDKCGYLTVRYESTDNPLQDYLGYFTGNHKWAREICREKLRELKAQGMEYLVIDLRSSGGGIHEVGMALTELLTNEKIFAQGLGIYKNGKYSCVSEHFIYGDGEFADLPVVALTNGDCVSAGDGLALYLSKLPNVTLAGITNPSGCGQETGGEIELTDGLVVICYPIGLCLNENGDPNIDTRADRISRNPVEEQIPFDMDAAMRMFRDKEDYELEWAMDYLAAKN